MGDARSKIMEALGRVVDHLTRRVDHLALYPCRVVEQRADGSLDLQAEDPRIGSPACVPCRTLPGIQFAVPSGTRVLLGFEAGDPSRPVALLWELGTVTTLRINGGSARVAREGDDVTRTVDMATWMTSVSTALGILTVPSVLGTVSEGSSVLRVPGG